MAGVPSVVYAIGTCDTKGDEVQFLANQLKAALSELELAPEVKVQAVDISISSAKTPLSTDVTPSEVLSFHMDPKFHDVASLPAERGQAVQVMSAALVSFLKVKHGEGALVGAVGLGGSGGTALAAPAMRALPVGVPKAIVSTVASGNTAQYVDTSDLVLIPSLVDVAGLNSVLRSVLTNAAWSVAGMVSGRLRGAGPQVGTAIGLGSTQKPTVGLTMFGVTTPCVDAVRVELEGHGMETLVFHATGTGGRAMESLVKYGFIQGVLDITTTEVADYVVGGVLACGPERFDATLERGIPLVLSVGALDMVNFGARDTIPLQFKDRLFVEHNPQVTLMRTTLEESEKFAEFIAEKLNRSTGPVRVLLPEGGVSMLDAPGKPFHDPAATGALLTLLASKIKETEDRKVVKLPHNINDPEFAAALVSAYLEIAAQGMGDSKQVQAEEDVQRPTEEAEEYLTSNNSFSELSLPKPPSGHPFLRGMSLPMGRVPSDASASAVGVGATRLRILENLRALIAAGRPIIGAGAGTGISAKFEEKGGVDLIILYNSGRFRMAGRGSLAGLLPFKDANAIVVEMAEEILPVVTKVPVLAGVCATDPFRRMPVFLRQLINIGFAGVQNFPTVGLYDGHFRQNLEETGMGFGLEVEMIAKAHAMGLLTTPYAFKPEEARAMAAAGADIIVAHMGLTTAGSIGARSALTLDQSAVLTQSIANAALDVNPDIIVLCHGGPLSGPKEAQYVLKRTRNVHGFYGASSMERLPVETAIVENVKSYKSLRFFQD